MQRRLVLNRTAQRQLDDMHARVVTLSGSAEVADRFILRLFERLEKLRWYPEDRFGAAKLRTTGFERKTTIAFRVSASTLRIVSVAFNYEQYQKHL